MFFKGWFSNTALTNAYDFNTEVTSDITVYAKWKKDVTPVTPTPEPEPIPGKEEPEEEDEEPEEEEPTPDPEPTPNPEPPIIPIIPAEPEPEDEDTDYIATIPVTEEVEVNNKVFTYVRTTEYGNLVCNKELQAFDISLF